MTDWFATMVAAGAMGFSFYLSSRFRYCARRDLRYAGPRGDVLAGSHVAGGKQARKLRKAALRGMGVWTP